MTGDGSSTRRIDPRTIRDRDELAGALTSLRVAAGRTVREVVAASGTAHGTVSSWFAGQHLPTPASRAAFERVLVECGVSDAQEREAWWATARSLRARPAHSDAAGAPYRGLAAFSVADAPLFFGRDALVAAILAELTDARKDGGGVVVVGPSGAGKSSLVHAGVVPALAATDGAFAGAAVTVVDAGAGDAAALLAGLSSSTVPAVVVLDQVERLLSDPGGGELLASLAEWVRDVAGVALLVLRADFFAQATAKPVLRAALARHQVLVGPMDTAELREVIVEPARRRGRVVEPALVDRLLGELVGQGGGSTNGALPLLSHALLTTWEHSDGGPLDVAAYEATGGIRGAVAASAEQAFAALSAAGQRAAKTVFLRLVDVDPSHPDTALITRRLVEPSELVPDGDPTAVDEVVSTFARARLLALGDDSVGVTHAVLLTAWPRLRAWVQEYRADVGVHRRLTAAADVWTSADRAPEYLLRGVRLGELSEWATDPERAAYLNADERALLAASELDRDAAARTARRGRRRLARLSTAATVFGVLALVLALVASVALGRARRDEASAVAARDAAVGVRLAVGADTLRSRDPNLAAQLALAAYRADASAQTRSALLDSTAGVVPARATGVDGTMAVAHNATGSVLAAGRSDGTVELYRLESGVPRLLTRLAAGIGDPSLYAAAFNPAGTVLAVGGRGPRVRLFDVRTPAVPVPLAALAVPGAPVRALAFSPDGRELVAGSDDGLVRRWDTTDPGAIAPLPPIKETGQLNAVAFTRDSAVLVTGASDGTVKLWALGRGVPTVLSTVPAPSPTDFVLALAVSPDDRVLAVGAKDKTVRLFDVTDRRAPTPSGPALTGPGSFVNGVGFSADGSTVSAASSDGSVYLWDRRTGSTTVLPGPAPATQALFLPGGSRLLTAATDGTLRVWPLASAPLVGARDNVFNAAFSASGAELVVGPNAGDGRVLRWDTSRRRDPRRIAPDLTAPKGVVLDSTISVSGSGALVASGTATGSVLLWDTRGRPQVIGSPLTTGLGLVTDTALSRDGRTLVAVMNPGVVLVWDVSDPAAPRERARLKLGNVGYGVTVSPDGRVLAVGAGDGTVRRWRLGGASPAELPRLSGFDNVVGAVAFSPDSTRLVAGSDDHTLIVWDVRDESAPRRLIRLRGPAGSVNDAAFSPDGRSVAAASEDGSVWLWSIVADGTATLTARLQAAGGRMFAVAFDPADASLVGFGAGDARAGRVWATDPEQVAARLCAAVGTPISATEWAAYAAGTPYAPPCG